MPPLSPKHMHCNQESLTQFENRIKPRVYVRRITRSKLHFFNRNWHQENWFCNTWVQPIHFSDYPKSLISRINEVYVFFNKISLFWFAIKLWKGVRCLFRWQFNMDKSFSTRLKKDIVLRLAFVSDKIIPFFTTQRVILQCLY